MMLVQKGSADVHLDIEVTHIPLVADRISLNFCAEN